MTQSRQSSNPANKSKTAQRDRSNQGRNDFKPTHSCWVDPRENELIGSRSGVISSDGPEQLKSSQ